MNIDDPVFVAGHRGLVGSAIVRRLREDGYENLMLRTRDEVDLRHGPNVRELLESQRPKYVFLAAAQVGGILANATYPADFIRDNLRIQVSVIEAARAVGVKKLLFLGSSCIYPKQARQPMAETELLAGYLEPTNDAYAIAKIAGIKMVQAYNRQYGTDYISIMPANLYGPGDNFDLETSHVLPALIRKVHEAKMAGQLDVQVWGTGKPRREFLFVDDLAQACLFLMRNYSSSEIINVGVGEEISIAALARLVAEVIGYEGDFTFDASKPDGTLRRLLDVSRIRSLGWRASTGLRQGIASTYDWYLREDIPA